MNIKPIPDHLRSFDWYAGYQSWLRDQGLLYHDPGEAKSLQAGRGLGCIV